MAEIFYIYAGRQRFTLVFPPFMLFPVAWLRLVALSLFFLPLVHAHQDILCKFSSLELSPANFV